MRLATLGLLALGAAACGGSSTASPTACERQAALLKQAGEPGDLASAARALGIVIRVDRALGEPAREAGGQASRQLAEIRQTDQGAMMTPLHTGVPGARRAIAQARALLRTACE